MDKEITMILQTRFPHFYANDNDNEAKPITFVQCDNGQIASWLPTEDGFKVKNYRNGIGTPVLQTVEGAWPQTFLDVEPGLSFTPDPAGGFFLVNEDNGLSQVDFGLGWRIKEWHIVATDADGNDIDEPTALHLLATVGKFSICDKIIWTNDNAGVADVISKHGYDNYINP
jgi:hypothetical protein